MLFGKKSSSQFGSTKAKDLSVCSSSSSVVIDSRMLLQFQFSECASSPAKEYKSVLAIDASNKWYAADGKEPVFSRALW
jgi:hypothetical protein